MTRLETIPRWKPTLLSVARILGRSLRSLLIIAAVVLLGYGVSRGFDSLLSFKLLYEFNHQLIALVVVVVVAWEFWHEARHSGR